MAKVITFPYVKEHGQFSIEEDDKGFTTILNEHPEVKTLFSRRQHYPDFMEINGVNPVFHVMIEGIIENQLHDTIGVREIFEKLQDEKDLTPHAARACIARIFIIDFFEVLKEHKPFELEAYVRRLSLIGTDVSNLGRNDRCPCGSSAKFKRCCAPYAEAFEVFQLAGRLDLGSGSYLLDELEDIKDPLNPIFQLEARFHISEYMEFHGDIEGAIEVLRESIAYAKFYQEGVFLENAWQDFMFFCQNHVQFAKEGLEASEQLLKLVDDDEEQGNLLCDRADFIAKMGNMEASEVEYKTLFDTLPSFHFARFRYASMLTEYNRANDAKSFLRDLLTNYRIDDETLEEALALLKQLGEDTTEFQYLF